MILRRILIANRGEIAVRIIRTCQRLGIATILTASEADLDSMAARLADETVLIGPPNSAESYLNVEAVVAAALRCKAEAIHPGYGFLSENADLALACNRANIHFIGPTSEQLDALGDKLKARTQAQSAGLPVVPGAEVANTVEAIEFAERVGWPVLLKAVAGGGGRGMKFVAAAPHMGDALKVAMAEGRAAFGSPRIYLEKYVSNGRHIEVQILGDGHTVIHLGTRDCSIQRRYQKLLEEAPAPNLSDALREELHRAAVTFAASLKYRGLGTVEFLVDSARQSFYFLEMNARIQVEHPVTEAICGLDLVEEQIAVAEGQKLRLRQDDVSFNGHAIECRINAEDCAHDFRPSPGSITRAMFPAGAAVRVDTHIHSGASVPSYYDSLLAKIIVHAANREEALRQLSSALVRCEIVGVSTNLGMHARLVRDAEFARGGVDTSFLPRFLQAQKPAFGLKSP